MNVVLAALNAQYVHMALAPWCLKAACADVCDVTVQEYTVNRDDRSILRGLMEARPDVLGFCTYLFNIEQVRALAADVRALLPETVIVFGGPEAGLDPDVFRACPAVDFVVRGEGETAFRALLLALRDGLDTHIPGVASRERDCPPAAEPDLGSLPSPYTDEMLAASAGRILYYEASRGCPFRCAYCLSSLGGGARFFPLDRVRAELARVLDSPARQVKFVDRTFNCRLSRAKEIVRAVLELAEENPAIAARHVHFEVAADLFDEELLDLFASAPPGLFQLEIGIQSFHAPTLAAVHRASDLARCAAAIAHLCAPRNVHVHTDLIAGLPLEDYMTFARSFDTLHALASHCIQLGFLKLLKGSEMRAVADCTPGYLYSEKPPYQVLQTPWLSFAELGRLEDTAFCVERLYNSGRFMLSLPYLIARFAGPFAFYEAFAGALRARGCFARPVAYPELCAELVRFAAGRFPGEADTLCALLRFDFYRSDNSGNPPRCLPREAPPHARALYAEKKGARVHFEAFPFDPPALVQTGETSGPVVYCFDYARRHPVTGLYTAARLEAAPQA
ncbi:B12-binding domain-containing radical SAM protein [Ethanoligenens harbinense]|uniref:Radical SAM domain protein n=1 Tax=Ethanoligenens harbinense (strain DSM 18485 / JCM 12961 / CGMCC 1.5033 / YUAN-3) TaxID=663278 RepID=E6U742_ETHHY|nr:B12-binding domain-containing radical SAM protein [Ethanoligenens harbinense]ADU28112.1 Radical SAM domain protein [Ethanoligenens harbinense YUAN-3]AVQ97121.1 B12-binding domain-containing radical SAM protein [Ethanoligenens harbinense YUAN-3]AYF39783.1 B12-binding domain-containing radical SAM protein [Ethanoligenens harbinense]AYF42615.1 B12-binding domain-containing radical SAM protein [Ethanoligenens harbinense]QCN93364.1 B12-binding domain-containing radical SAM protein [Ethanoligenen